jgi:DNA-binding CsgD family transcriptional regulator
MPAPDQRGCPYCDAGSADRESPEEGQPEPVWLTHLYVCRSWSTYRIAGQTGLSRQRVTSVLRTAEVAVRPRGAGRPRSAGKSDDPAGLSRILRELYEDSRLSSRQIAEILGMPERTVRDRLRMDGVATRTRGGRNREDRNTIPAEVLDLFYTRLGMTAAEVGKRLGMSANTVLRSAHALGVPVRSGGPILSGSTGPLPGPEEIELISALYADPLIAAVLTAHDIRRVPPGGSVSERFPEPLPLTTPLAKDLYWGCGVSLNHIELLTGQPTESVRRFMHRAGVPLRHSGGRTPFLRRWRSGLAAGAHRAPWNGSHRESSPGGRAPSGEASRAKRAASS